jgi:hypothetical protein
MDDREKLLAALGALQVTEKALLKKIQEGGLAAAKGEAGDCFPFCTHSVIGSKGDATQVGDCFPICTHSVIGG